MAKPPEKHQQSGEKTLEPGSGRVKKRRGAGPNQRIYLQNNADWFVLAASSAHAEILVFDPYPSPSRSC
jgi:hypothetical protein